MPKVAKSPAGYSGTPLVNKLGIKPGFVIKVTGEPSTYWDLVSPLPERVEVKQRPGPATLDLCHVFVTSESVYRKELVKAKGAIRKTGMIWISWPKKSSGVASDLDENIIRDIALRNGLVDVKVCAVDPVWSGLKLVYRLQDR